MIRLYCHSVHKHSHSRSFRSFAHSFTHAHSVNAYATRYIYVLRIRQTYKHTEWCVLSFTTNINPYPIGTIVQQKRIQSVLSAFSHSWCIHLFCVRFSLCHNSSFFSFSLSVHALSLSIALPAYHLHRFHSFGRNRRRCRCRVVAVRYCCILPAT